MSKLLTLLMMVIFSMSAAPALAKKVPAQDAAMMVLDQIEENGYDSVGNISLNELRKAFKKITIKEITVPIFLVGSGSRTGAINLTEKNEIIINPLSFQRYTHAQALLLLIHELLGANGYNDEHYQITTRLYLLATSKVRLEKDAFIQDYKRGSLRKKNVTYQSTTKNGGTVTGVGGGGDGEVVEFKCNLFDTLIEDSDRDPNNAKWLNHYVDMQIELDQHQEEEYKFTVLGKGKVMATINGSLWQNLSVIDRKLKHLTFIRDYVKVLTSTL